MNPTPAPTSYPQTTRVVVEERRSPMSVVIRNMLYGGGAGALVGLGVALIDQDNYVEDVLIGTGVGLIAGGIVGGIQAYTQETGNDVLSRRALARDGLGTLARDHALQRPMTRVAALTLRY